jgi:hypothetical protein
MKGIILILLMCLFISSVPKAQGFQEGKLYIGPTIGYGLGFGAGLNGELAIRENYGVGVDIAYEGFSQSGNYYSYYGGNYSWSWDYKLFGMLVFGSYHFQPGNQFDPFLKVGIGYFNWNATYSDNNGSSITLSSPGYTSGFGYTAQAGFHYFISPFTAFRLAAGYPFYVSGGVDFIF